MPQTKASREALIRDEWLCQYCLRIVGQERHIFQIYVPGYHPLLAGAHHVLGRRNVDTASACIALCSEHHHKAEAHIIPKVVFVALASHVSGVNLFKKYRHLCKFTDEEWSVHYDSTTEELAPRESLDSSPVE